MLAVYSEFPHNGLAAATTAAWFGDQNVPGRTTASRRYFYVRTQLRTLFGRAIAGIPSGMPVPLDAGSPTLLSARPPHLAMNGGPSMSKEVAMRAHALARPEQLSPPRFTWTGDNLTFGGPTFVHFRDEAGRYCFFGIRKVVRVFDDIDPRGQQRIREVMRHVVAHGANRWRYRYRSLIARSLGGACHG